MDSEVITEFSDLFFVKENVPLRSTNQWGGYIASATVTFEEQFNSDGQAMDDKLVFSNIIITDANYVPKVGDNLYIAEGFFGDFTPPVQITLQKGDLIRKDDLIFFRNQGETIWKLGYIWDINNN